MCKVALSIKSGGPLCFISRAVLFSSKMSDEGFSTRSCRYTTKNIALPTALRTNNLSLIIPSLSQAYSKAQGAGKDFEVVYVPVADSAEVGRPSLWSASEAFGNHVCLWVCRFSILKVSVKCTLVTSNNVWAPAQVWKHLLMT